MRSDEVMRSTSASESEEVMRSTSASESEEARGGHADGAEHERMGLSESAETRERPEETDIQTVNGKAYVIIFIYYLFIVAIALHTVCTSSGLLRPPLASSDLL